MIVTTARHCPSRLIPWSDCPDCRKNPSSRPGRLSGWRRRVGRSRLPFKTDHMMGRLSKMRARYQRKATRGYPRPRWGNHPS